MPKPPLRALIWSSKQSLYELYTQGQLNLRFRVAEEVAWLAWLGEVSSFAFHSPAGSLNVYQEQRPHGGQYWYAYHTSHGRTHKRYLGRTGNLSLARLEETARMLSHAQKPNQAPNQEMLVLSGKLAPPRLPGALVERERLLSALDGAHVTPLTLVSAPAGWGKTTLLSSWASRHKAQVAWLSLDELDTSPARFWVALIAALRHCGRYTSDFGETVVTLLQSPQPPPFSSCLSALLVELESRESHPAPLVLILDDYQIIEEPVIHESLSFFLEHLPASLHLILASRADPNLPLARLRVRGQLTEIRADELRFQESEASQYLGYLLFPVLSPEEVRKLVSRTEGWIAGLHLAALTLQKRADRAAYLEALTGSQRYLLDYVQEEILARLPESVCDFLLHTAILTRLDALVCQAVTAAPTTATSQQMLSSLERANLFLVPLDEERHRYRLHELFREALLSVLHTTRPEMVPLLHRRAATFYEAQGQWHEAIAHALAAADYSTAARLMEQTVEQFWLRGDAETLVSWALELPEPVVREYARLLLTTALYLLNTVTQAVREQREKRHKEVRRLMAQVETALQRERDEVRQEVSATDAGTASLPADREARAAEDTLLHRRLHLLHMHMILDEVEVSGEHERLSAMQQEIEEELERDEEAIWQIVPLVCSFILHHSVWRTGAKLLPRLLKTKEQVSQQVSPFASLKVEQYLAYLALQSGKLRLASQESQAALDLIEQITGYALLKGHFEIVLAQVWYQWNRLEEARDLLRAALHDAAAWQHLYVLGMGYARLMQVELARGEWSLAESALHELEQLGQREHHWAYSDWLPVLRAQWWLALGQLEAASNWAAGVVFPEGSWDGSDYYDAFPVVMRVYFATLRFREALELLDRFSAHLDRPGNIEIAITYLAQSLVALHHAGQNDEARAIAARLFALTEPEGYIRVYLDEGQPMREALLAVLTSHSGQHDLAPFTRDYISRLLVAFEQEEPGLDRSPEVISIAEPAPSPTLIAPLTRREQEVLRLLASGASNQDIAHTLVISLDTVKKHVSNLLGKLGASSRTQVVAQARARSLL